MLLRHEQISIRSDQTPDEICRRLDAAANDWKESHLSPAARLAGVIAWKVRRRDGQIVIRARLAGANSFLPRFVGRILPAGEGASIDGELRVHWFTRGFMCIWLVAAASAPVIALIAGVPGQSWSFENVLGAAFMLVPSAALVAFGIWFGGRAYAQPAAAVRELLAMAAAPSAAPIEISAQGV